MRGFFARAIPGMIASAVPQLLAIAGAMIASSSPSAVSWLYFANRLIELPLGIVGVAMGTVLMPELTRALRGGDKDAIAHAESRGLELAAGLALPATLGLIVLSAADRAAAVRARRIHGGRHRGDRAGPGLACAGLAGHVLVKALSPAFFAREDTWTPMLATLNGFVVRDRARAAARPLRRQSASPSAIAVGALEHGAASLIRAGRARFGFRSTPRRGGGCRASSLRRW